MSATISLQCCRSAVHAAWVVEALQFAGTCSGIAVVTRGSGVAVATGVCAPTCLAAKSNPSAISPTATVNPIFIGVPFREMPFKARVLPSGYSAFHSKSTKCLWVHSESGISRWGCYRQECRPNDRYRPHWLEMTDDGLEDARRSMPRNLSWPSTEGETRAPPT